MKTTILFFVVVALTGCAGFNPGAAAGPGPVGPGGARGEIGRASWRETL